MVNSCSHVIVCVINGTCTSSLASGWHTSSSCPPPRPSSPVDTSHLWWSPPGCRGNELVSLEPIYIHIYEKNKIKKKKQNWDEQGFQNKDLTKTKTYIFWGNRAMCLVIFLIVHMHVPIGIIFSYASKTHKKCSKVFLAHIKKGSDSLFQYAFLQLLVWL